MKHNSIKHNSHEQRNALLRVRRKLNHLQPSSAYWSVEVSRSKYSNGLGKYMLLCNNIVRDASDNMVLLEQAIYNNKKIFG
jgi:hypothetical protein